MSNASFGTIKADLHRLRRGAFAKLFSASSIIKLDPLIEGYVGLLCRRIEEHRQAKKIVDLGNAYRCAAIDIVSDYVLPINSTLLEDELFAAEYHNVVRKFTMFATLDRHLGWLIWLIRAMPRWLVLVISPTAAVAVYDNEKVRKEISRDPFNNQFPADTVVQRVKEQARMVIQSGGALSREKDFPVVLNSIYHSNLPPSEKSLGRLCDDAFTLVTAGGETTSLTLTTVTFHMLANPHIRAKLETELREHFPDCEKVIGYRELAKLPYLTACLNEGLRLSSPVSGRLPRIDPSASPIGYGDYVLPAGTVISMSPRHTHYDPSIYPDPTAFRPERWLEDPVHAGMLKERYLVPFGKDARACVGKNLAMAELFAILGNVFRRFPDMQLYQTTHQDVDMAFDFFTPLSKLDSKGLRVLIPQPDG